MFPFTERTTLETEVEKTDTKYGFTWVSIDGKYRIRTPDDKFKEVPKVVVDTLREKASDAPFKELVAETEAQDSGAADVLREMYEGDFVRGRSTAANRAQCVRHSSPVARLIGGFYWTRRRRSTRCTST